MAEFDKELRDIALRVQNARIKLMREQPFFASLLMHMRFAVDIHAETMYTDAKMIGFSPTFVNALSDKELEFVLMHEVLHAALGHCTMPQEEYDHFLFNVACDIVVNSNILHAMGIEDRGFYVDGAECMYRVPGGDNGYKYTAPEVYAMLVKYGGKGESRGAGKGSGNGERDGSSGSSGQDNRTGSGQSGSTSAGQQRADSAAETQRGNGKRQKSQSAAETAGGGGASPRGGEQGNGSGGREKTVFGNRFDDHSKWGGETDRESEAQWRERLVRATEIAAQCSAMYGGQGCGKTPLGAERLLGELTEARIDWRTVLDNFIQEEINDYTFSPPDRRFGENDFFLPDFNDREESIKNIVFLIDTSGSMSDGMIRDAYSEIKGAIEQFSGRFEGFLAFGDTKVYTIEPFSGERDITEILPRGGGGTDFEGPIRYVLEHMEEKPACMIYITDGYCSYPDERVTDGVPFLWLLTTDAAGPKWGRVVRMQKQGA